MLLHRQVWQCLCNEQWPTQRCVGFKQKPSTTVIQWCSYAVVQQMLDNNCMKSKLVSVRPIWSPHFNVLWIGEWFTAAGGALKTFTKSPRVLTFDETNPTWMTEQCSILVWLFDAFCASTRSYHFQFFNCLVDAEKWPSVRTSTSYLWHFPRLSDAASCWGYVRWPARDEKQSQDSVLVCEGEIVAKRCKKVFEVCTLYFAEGSVYTGRKYALRVETDAFQQAFLQLGLWIQRNWDFVASVRNANIRETRETLYKGFCKRSCKTVIFSSHGSIWFKLAGLCAQAALLRGFHQGIRWTSHVPGQLVVLIAKWKKHIAEDGQLCLTSFLEAEHAQYNSHPITQQASSVDSG